jgi:tRNA nucleotidyltransferase (CCA-adding enzyme)
MVEQGEVEALVPERVWQETEKALREPAASEFFKLLRDCGALKIVFPEVNALFGVPQPEKWHPEIDTGVHTLMVLDQAVRLSADVKVRFAALVHDLGKGTTPHAEWPGHRGHEERSVTLIESLCDRLKLPSEYRELSIIVARYHGNVHRAFELRPNTILGILEKIDAFRRPERFAQALLACEADSRGRLGLEENPYPQRQYLQAARDAAATIKPTPEDIADQVGPLIAERIHQRRLRAITELTSRVQPRHDV